MRSNNKVYKNVDVMSKPPPPPSSITLRPSTQSNSPPTNQYYPSLSLPARKLEAKASPNNADITSNAHPPHQFTTFHIICLRSTASFPSLPTSFSFPKHLSSSTHPTTCSRLDLNSIPLCSLRKSVHSMNPTGILPYTISYAVHMSLAPWCMVYKCVLHCDTTCSSQAGKLGSVTRLVVIRRQFARWRRGSEAMVSGSRVSLSFEVHLACFGTGSLV